MFGGLTKTSSRIAIAAALGLTLGGFAFKATPAKAADLGGDCCADLEERVAELEATTVRKGNKKVSVTISGWVIKSMNFWDDGRDSGFAVGDKDYDLGSRFAITGSATIAPGWSAGYNLTVNVGGTNFGINSNSTDEFAGVNSRLYGSSFGNINTLYSYIYIKSDTFGTLNWGHLSPASDNPAVLADISGTVIESNFVFFEGGGFATKAKHSGGGSGAAWNNFLLCSSAVAPGADCFGAAEPAVRYNSPTWGGFRFETSVGTADVVPAILDADAGNTNTNLFFVHPSTDDSHFWDLALFYTADWNSIKISLAGAYTWMESNPLNGGQENYWQIGGSVMHKPSGLGIYATGNWENVSADKANCTGPGPFGSGTCLNSLSFSPLPDTNSWGIKPFWRKTWSPIGATVLYGEYAQYNDFYGLGNINNVAFTLPACTTGGLLDVCTFTSSQAERWGLGVVQEIELGRHACVAEMAASEFGCYREEL